MNRKAQAASIAVTAVLALVVVIAAVFHRLDERSPFAARPASPATMTAAALPPPDYDRKPASILDRETGPDWRSFRDRFGAELRAQFLPDGRLASARGSLGASRPTAGFDPKDREKVLARARAIVIAANRMLGVQGALPLREAEIRTGDASAQVYFTEAVGTVPVEPLGKVTVDLGPQGELLAMYSSYVPGLKLGNDRKLTPEQALKIASAEGGKAEGGSASVWITADGQAHHAYETYVRGIQIVVDAQDGKILYKRDRRAF